MTGSAFSPSAGRQTGIQQRDEKTLENTENLTIRQGEVTKLLVEEGKITGVLTYSGAVYHCKAVILCTGTYLKARCIYGDVSNATNRTDSRSQIISQTA